MKRAASDQGAELHGGTVRGTPWGPEGTRIRLGRLGTREATGGRRGDSWCHSREAQSSQIWFPRGVGGGVRESTGKMSGSQATASQHFIASKGIF